MGSGGIGGLCGARLVKAGADVLSASGRFHRNRACIRGTISAGVIGSSGSRARIVMDDAHSRNASEADQEVALRLQARRKSRDIVGQWSSIEGLDSA